MRHYVNSFFGIMSPKVRLICVAVLVGTLSGAAAALLKWVIGMITHGVLNLDSNVGLKYIIPLLPVVGILLVGIYQRYILKMKLSHGVDMLVDDIADRRFCLSPRLVYAPIVASSVTLGFGGSAGSEGPIAYTGAAIGSNFGRICGFNSSMMRDLIACGAAAGIAGIFKAPVGGAMFALEVLGISMGAGSVIALFTSTLTAALMAYALSDFTVDLPWKDIPAFDMSMVLPILVLGVACGIYSVYYSFIMKHMEHVYDSMRSPWMRNIVSGSMLALLLFFFPALYGEGYGIIGGILNGNDMSVLISHFSLSHDNNVLMIVLTGILLVKCFAASASNSGGGVAGDFAPTLFAGAMAGLLFGLVLNNLMGMAIPLEVTTYVGMSAVMAGVIRAPLMAVFLTSEMCSAFEYLLPLVLASIVSYGMVMLVTHRKFYHPHHHRNKTAK